MQRLRRATGGTMLAVALGMAASWAGAHAVDPSLPMTVVVGPPRGASPMGRVDGARTGRARDRLPRHPRLLWRTLAHGGLELVPVAVDARGAVVVGSANLPEVSQIGPDGREQWRTTVGVGPPVTGPVLLSDDTRVVVTSGGEAVGLWPDGRVRFRTDLGLPGRNARVSPLPLEDGGVAIAIGSEIVLVDGDGHLASRQGVGERIVGALVQTDRGVVATSDHGIVYAVQRARGVEELGSLGGDPGPGAAAPDGHTLAAVVDHKRLVTFDLLTRAAETRFVAPSPSMDGPIARGPSGAWFMTDFAGVLLSYSGAEMRRLPLGAAKPSLMTDAGAVNLNAMAESPGLAIDGDGFIAFARVGGSVGIVAPDGATSFVNGANCPAPAALAPAGELRMVVACRDGSILMAGD